MGKDLPNAFNKHFIAVCQRLCREIPEARKQTESYIKVYNAQFQFREVCQNEVVIFYVIFQQTIQRVEIKCLLNL